MAKGINKVILVGTVGKDPEVKYFQSGDAYCSISVATNESWKDKDGNKQERTEWHTVKFTRKLAEIVGEYVRKGSTIYIEGALRTEKYTDKQNIERYSTAIIANEMQMLGGKPSSDRGEQQADFSHAPAQAPAQRSAPRPPAQAAPQPAAATAGWDSDIPF